MGNLLLQIIYLCTIGCAAYTCGWLIVKAGRNRTTLALAVCQLLVIIWCIPLLFTGFLETTGEKYLAYGISYAGISFIGPAWLLFSAGYCEKRIGSRWRTLLFIGSAFDYAMFLSNETHHLFYRIFTADETIYGPVFYFHMAYTYLCVLGGMAVVWKEFMKKRVAARQLAVIFLVGIIPLGFNFLYLSGIIKSGFDLTPPAFAWSVFLMLLAVFRYDFLDVNPMAFEQIFDSIAEGTVVYDRRGKLTYYNQAAKRWLGIERGDSLEEIEGKLTALGFSIKGTMEGTAEAQLSDGIRLRLRRYDYRDRDGQMAAGAMVLTDVSEFYQLLKQSQALEASARELAVEKERNRIAQEVHDTTGHTLTMIQSLLRLMRSERENQDSLNEYMLQAQELVAGGIRELRCSINELRRKETMTVTQSVLQLTKRVKEISVETEIRGEDDPKYSPLSLVVYGVLREGITNCLKYAGASRMDVIVRFEKESLSLFIFDDGRGCEEIRENHGLRGIRERVEIAGGTVRFLSSAGEGFQIYVNLPVKEKENDSCCDC